MQIRITNSFIDGAVQFTAGQVLNLPTEIAEQLVEDGRAVVASKAELAAMPRRVALSGFVPTVSAVQKGRR